MRHALYGRSLAGLAASIVIMVSPGTGRAANANHPYSNIDPRVDAGNDTGDARVDQLNQAQLGGAGEARRPAYGSGYPQAYARPGAYGYAGQARAYYPPTYYPPAYYAPPAYYRPPVAVVPPGYYPPY